MEKTPTAPRSLMMLSGWAQPRGKLRGVLIVVLTAIVFILLFNRIPLTDVLQYLRAISLPTWAAATLLTLSFPIFSAIRWHLTLRSIGERIPVRRCLAIILGTSPISAVAPSKAGDLLKAVSLRGEVSILEVTGTVLVERALDVLILAVFSLLGGLFIGNVVITRAAAAILGIGSAGLLVLPLLVSSVRAPRLREKLDRLMRTLRALSARPLLASGIVLLTGLNWLASLVQTHLLLRAVGADPPFALTAAALPMAIFVGLLPVTVGGMGTRDAALVTLLAPVVSSAQTLSVGLLYSFFGYWLPAVLGLPFLGSAFGSSKKRSITDDRPQDNTLQPRNTERACKICGGPTRQQWIIAGTPYFSCAACDFLQTYYWDQSSRTRADQRVVNDEARERLWQPGDMAHERAKGWEILGFLTWPVAWWFRRVHATLRRFPPYERWYQAHARRAVHRLLDFGSGEGTIVRELRKEGFDCVGLDPYAPSGSPNVVRAFLADAPFPPASFDAIFSIETLEHIPNVLETFRNLQRLLRPGGTLLVQTRRLEDPEYRAQGAQWFYLKDPSTHISIYSKRALREIARRCGFRSVSFRGVKFARFQR